MRSHDLAPTLPVNTPCRGRWKPKQVCQPASHASCAAQGCSCLFLQKPGFIPSFKSRALTMRRAIERGGRLYRDELLKQAPKAAKMRSAEDDSRRLRKRGSLARVASSTAHCLTALGSQVLRRGAFTACAVKGLPPLAPTWPSSGGRTRQSRCGRRRLRRRSRSSSGPRRPSAARPGSPSPAGARSRRCSRRRPGRST